MTRHQAAATLTIALAAALSACHTPVALAAPVRAAQPPAVRSAASLTGDWTVHTYIGSHYFADKLHLDSSPTGALTGTFTVADKWTATLEKVRVSGDTLSFEILAPEGAKPFRVYYRAQIEPKATTMTGFATLDGGELLGGFVAQKDQVKS